MKAFQLKVTVKNKKPPVWWRVMVPSGISFSALSVILNAVIGLPAEPFVYDFYQRVRVSEPDGNQELKGGWDQGTADAAGTMIDDFVEVGKAFSYYNGPYAFKVNVEAVEEEHPCSSPTLVKYKADEDYSKKNDVLRERFTITRGKPDYRTRKEILREAAAGTCRIVCAQKPVSREGAYRMSAREFLSGIGNLLRSEINNEDMPLRQSDGYGESQDREKTSGKYSMRACLDWYRKRDIQDIAKRLGIRKWYNKNVDDLREEVAVRLLDPEIIRRDFGLLNDREIRAFEDAIAARGAYRIPKEQQRCFETLDYMGYAYLTDDGFYADIPEELTGLYAEISTPEFHETRRRVSWVKGCLNRIVPLYYAILPMDKFCRLCRRTENPVITPEEVPELLKRIPEEEQDSILSEDMIVGKQLIEDPELMEDVKTSQGNKPFYIMRQREIEELVENGYPTSAGAYRRLKEFLRRELRMREEEEIETDLRMVHMMIALCHPMQTIVDYLENKGLKFGEEQIDEFVKLYQALVSCTPTYFNRGYTAGAMGKILDASGPRKTRYDQATLFGK